MDFETLIQDPVNVEIISLLMVSNLAFLEKKSWVLLLPNMNEEQKIKLKNNLQQEVDYESKISQQAFEEFMNALESSVNEQESNN